MADEILLPHKERTLKEIEGILYNRINIHFKNNCSENFWVPPFSVIFSSIRTYLKGLQG